MFVQRTLGLRTRSTCGRLGTYIHLGRCNLVCSFLEQPLGRTRKMGTADARPKVFITRRVPEIGPKLLSSACEISQWDSDDPIQRSELLKRVRGMDALFCLLTDGIDGEVLDAAGPGLKVVGTMSVGYDHVDLSACAERGVKVGFTPDVLTNAVAELTIALLLATSRRLKEAMRAVVEGTWGSWKPLWLCGPGLEGATVGIVGLGRIGLAVARCIKPFGVARLVYAGKSDQPAAKELEAEQLALDELLTVSDFVLACVSLTPSTKEMFNMNAFKKMKKTAVFINTSRGGVVQQDDLYQALVTGEIAAAGLDVTTPEPLPTDSPLLKLDNCVVLPHIASATYTARGAMSELTARNILAALQGSSMPSEIKPK